MRYPLLILLAALVIPSQQQECEQAAPCDPSTCLLPSCSCSGSDPPVNGSRPQLVYISFDDALTSQASTLYYEQLFGTPAEPSNTNPNGCAIRGTHFVTHQYTDYSLVNRWWHYGHEIASHSITHRNNLTYWRTMGEEEWYQEMAGQRRITAQFANIPPCEISGVRSPFLQGGGNTMYSMMSANHFSYDCTWPTREYGYVDAEMGLYPYTLDAASVQDCEIAPCPTCSFPGFWQQPMTDLEDEWIGAVLPGQGNPCSMLDACTIIPHDQYVDQDPRQVYDMLMKNFLRVYEGDESWDGDFHAGNRAPWGLYMHAAWFFGQDWHFQGYKMFVEEISTYGDVWIVPVKSGIDYMRASEGGMVLSNEELVAAGKASGPFACQDIEDKTGKYDTAANKCGGGRACQYTVDIPEDGLGGERYMTVCSAAACPPSYPWLETQDTNTCGGALPCADCSP